MSANQSLREQTASGLSWRFLTEVAQVVLQFGVGVLLARLLPPEDFGLVGLALIVINFGRIVSDLGLAESIVQYKHLARRHVRVGFTCSVLLGLLVTGCTYALAPLIADFFRDERITSLLRFIGISFFFTGLSIVAEALLRRRMNFKLLMIVEILSYGLGYGLVAVSLALAGFGEWSLAWGVVVQSVVNALLAYGLVRHAVRPLAALEAFKDLAGFGLGSSLTRIVNYFARKGDFFVVGRLLGPGPLGLYTRAYQTMKSPLGYSGHVLSKVLFPAVSRIQEETERVRSAYAKAISMTSLVTAPVLAIMFVLAPEIVIGLFGEQWEGAIRPLRILTVFGLFRTTYHVAAVFIKSRGFIYRLLAIQVVYAASVLGGTWVSAGRWGIEGVALAVGGSILIMWGLVTMVTNRITGTTTRQLVDMYVPGVVLTGLTLAFCLICRYAFLYVGFPDLLVLVCSVISTLLLVLGALHILPALIIHPITQVLNQMLEQEVFSDRITDFLYRLLPLSRTELA